MPTTELTCEKSCASDMCRNMCRMGTGFSGAQKRHFCLQEREVRATALGALLQDSNVQTVIRMLQPALRRVRSCKVRLDDTKVKMQQEQAHIPGPEALEELRVAEAELAATRGLCALYKRYFDKCPQVGPFLGCAYLCNSVR